ncbi:ricin-type beta-trefoil lectin domain protein, partial [Streptomyces sp. NPDC047928]
FHKYVVTNVQELPGVSGVAETTTSYTYVGGGAWALNQGEFSKKKTRTYDQWRGYGLVRTIEGADSADTYRGTKRSMSETRYFRGMDGDPLPDGTKRSVTVTDSAGATIAVDKEPFQGRVAETLTYDGVGGNLLTRSVDYPVAVELASRARDGGIPALKAYRVQESHNISVTRASGTLPGDTRTWRTTKTATTYEDTYGLPVKVETQGDTGKTGDESCTALAYVHNTAKHLIGLSKETVTTAGTCAAAATATAADWMGGSRVAYDNGAYGAAPTVGLATTTWDVSSAGGSWTQTGTVAYDSYGRPTTTTDAAGNAETITYTPATGQVYSITTKNPLNHSETTYVEPGRGVSLKEVDANGRSTSFAYDALGRTTKGWRTSQATTEDPSVKMTYNTTPGEPVSVVTETLNHRGDYETSVVFYDGLGRERQSQEPAVGKGRLITDTIYSANGTISRTNNAYYAAGEPQTVMYELASDFNVPNATLYKYDGAGRILAETPYEAGTEKPEKATKYEYGFDYSTVIPPTGAASQRTFIDAMGRIVRADTFTNAARTTARSITYEYNARGDQSKAVDSKGNTWSWTYDARGRQASTTDPDTGTTSRTYDALNRPVTTTNARGVTVWIGYDKLSRPVEERLGSSTGTLLTSTTYDTVIGGLGLPATATRYTDGLPYTTTVTGYTPDYQMTGQKLTLPASIASAYGLQENYSYAYEYDESGLMKSASMPAAGGLSAEKVVTRYNEDGLPISTSGLDWYTAETNYSVYGQVLRAVTGEHPNRVWTTSLYDERTGALTQNIVDRESISDTSVVTGHRVNSRAYTYDNAGNVTKLEDTSNGATDRQCFRYDTLGQLARAWTTHDAACTVDSTGKPTTVTIGGKADGYDKAYTYDELGNRVQLDERHMELVDGKTVLDPTKDARTTYTYGKADGSQPHTLTGMSSTYIADSGAKVTQASSREYDATGNTKTRVDGGDTQALSWTWDGKVEKVTGFGDKGSGAWVGLAGKCLDLSSASTVAGTALQLYSCNGSRAQKLRIEGSTPTDSSKGALKILKNCVMPKDGATANGTPVVIAACTGAANQEWTTVPAGNKLKHIASGKCLDVPGANSASGTDLQLSTCDTNGTAQSWVPANETTYVYGPGGERLMAVSAGERTLYLGDTTVSMTSTGAHSHTERYYSQPGAPTVMRSVYGTGTSTLSMQEADQTGTVFIDVTLAPGNAVKFNKLDAFGVERNEHNNWRSHRGYVGGDDDRATGLVHLGAREYDPVTGRFISADMVLDLADPVQMNGYVYCENNPVTFADPSGEASESSGGGDYGGPSNSEVAWANAQLNKSVGDIILSVGWAALKQFIGWDDVVGCFSRGDLWACGKLFISAIPWTKVTKIPGVLSAAKRIAGAISAWMKAKEKARKILEMARKAKEAARKAAAAKKAAAKKAAQLAKKKAQEAATRAAKKAAQKTGNKVQKAKKAQAKNSEKPSGNGKGKPSCEDNSFTPGTRVLMADGTTKPIDEVENGDKVVATDPETGQTGVETVTAEIEGKGTKKLVDVTIDTDGDKGDATATVTATDGHPFWVPELGSWLEATDLKAGDWLQTSAGTFVQITAVERRTAQSAAVHNLTVSGHHTYFVVAAETPLLVHNCNVAAKRSYDRAKQLHEKLKKPDKEDGGYAYKNDTTAVLMARDANGDIRTVVASNRPYVPRQIKDALQEGEVYANGRGHAEVTALRYIDKQGWTLLGGAANRNVCAFCENTLRDRGAKLVGDTFGGRLQVKVNGVKRFFNYMGERMFQG